MAYPYRYSIVMTTHNRKDQLLFTLRTISYSSIDKSKLEIIIVDDGSREEHRIDLPEFQTPEITNLVKLLNIKFFYIDAEDKDWVNPCIAYNLGLLEAKGEIIIIQNAEVAHIGDCLKLVEENLQPNDWLTLNCYGLGNFTHNHNLYSYYTNPTNQNSIIPNNSNINSDANSQSFNSEQFIKDIYKFILSLVISKKGEITGGDAVNNQDVQGWLNHNILDFRPYHYFAAIYAKDLHEKLGGGFCEDYKDGLCCDDDDLVTRLVLNKFNFKTTKFHPKYPFVIHQFHERSSSFQDRDLNIKKLAAKNNKLFYQKCQDYMTQYNLSQIDKPVPNLI